MAKAAHVMSKTWRRNHIPLMSKPRDLDRMLRLKAQFTSYLKQLQHMDSSNRPTAAAVRPTIQMQNF